MRSLLHSVDRARLLQRLEALRPDAAPRWGRMSAAGMVCHLTDSFRVVLGRRTSRTSTLLERTVIRLIALTLPVAWPRGIETVAEVDQERGGTRPEDFVRDLVRLRSAESEFVARLRHDARSMSHRSSAEYRQPNGAAGATATSIITCGSSASDRPL